MGYEEKYRIRAVEYRKEGHTIKETAKIYKIGTTTLKTWMAIYNETGEIKNKPLKRTFKKVDPIKLEKHMEDNPDAYLSEISEVFSCSDEAIRQNLKKLKITRRALPTILRHTITVARSTTRPMHPMTTPGLKASYSGSKHIHIPTKARIPPMVPIIIATKLLFFFFTLSH